MIILGTSNILWVEEPNTIEYDALDEPTITTFRCDKPYAFMISWDDEYNDLPFSFLEDRIGMKHTSFVVTSRINNSMLWGLDMLFRGHDIQSHGLYHSPLGLNLNDSYRRLVLEQSIYDIERMYGYTPILFAYPYGSTDEYVSKMVLEYYDVARGTRTEGLTTTLGIWFIDRPDDARHSIGDCGGIGTKNAHLLLGRFNDMTKKGAGRAFKTYGHTHDSCISVEDRPYFFEMLEQVSGRNDTWYTTWGEAVAYWILSTNTSITEHHVSNSTVSFKTTPTVDINRYPIRLTYKVNVPLGWTKVYVTDNKKSSSVLSVVEEDGKKYALIESIPQGQVLYLSKQPPQGTPTPTITDLRTIITDEGTLFMFDVLGSSAIIDVNLTIYTLTHTYFFEEIMNPTFWFNSTYGRVVFGESITDYTVVINVVDASGNIGRYMEQDYA